MLFHPHAQQPKEAYSGHETVAKKHKKPEQKAQKYINKHKKNDQKSRKPTMLKREDFTLQDLQYTNQLAKVQIIIKGK